LDNTHRYLLLKLLRWSVYPDVKWICHAFLLVLLIYPAIDCDSQDSGTPMHFKHLNIQDGLISSMITEIVEDHRGVLWISTFSGLSRFDGTEFTNYSASNERCGLANDHILDLNVGPDGNIYMVTRIGWSMFNVTEQCFYNFELDPGFRSSIAQNVWSVYPDTEGIVWLGTHNGLAKYSLSEHTYKHYITPSNALMRIEEGTMIREVHPDSVDKNRLVLTVRGQLCYFDFRDELFHFDIPPAKWPYHDFVESRSLHIFNDSIYWSGTWGSGLGQYNVHNQEWSYHMTKQGRQHIDPLSGNAPWDMANGVLRFDDNHVWIGFQRGLGILSLDNNDVELVEHDPNDPFSISNNQVVSIIRSQSGVIYLGTANGINIFDGHQKRMSQFDPEKQRSAVSEKWYKSHSTHDLMLYCARIPLDNHHLLYSDAIRGGINILDLKSMRSEHLSVELENGNSRIFNNAMRLENGNILLASNRELFIYQPGAQRIVTLPGSINDTLNRIRLNRPNLAASSAGDLFVWNSRHMIRSSPDNVVAQIHSKYLNEDVEIKELVSYGAGRMMVWLNNYAYVIEGDSLRPLPMSGVPVSTVRAGVSIEDTLWIGTHSSGIYKYHLKRDSLHLLYRYTTEDGLPSNNVTRLTYDGSKNLWGTTHSGIFRLNLTNDYVRTYDLRDGVELAYIDEPVVFFPDGSVVFDDRRYIYCLKPDTQRNFDGKAYIKSFEFADSVFYVLDHVITLAPFDNTVTIQMGIIDHIYGPRDELFYRLDGFDEAWERSGKERSARYTNLRPGDYRLQVRARNPDGVYSETVYAAFTIQPALYQRTWFLPGLVILILMGMYMVFRMRIRNLKRVQFERDQHNKKIAELELKALRSQMNPHFMFNSLNSIKNYIQKAEPQKASEYLSNFAHLIRLTLQHSREKNVSLEKELEALLLYIDLEKLRFRESFEFNCTVEESVDLSTVTIPPMILQPYVENAIWHGLLHKDGQRQLSLYFKRMNGMLECSIEDNGIGRDKAMDIKSKSATRYKSMGMGITRDRLDILNQLNQLGIELEIIDKKDADDHPAGTRVNIKIPYESNSH
jgi:ligand-binding sensor domain-containing protein